MTIPSAVTTGVTNLNTTLSTLGSYLQASIAARRSLEQQISNLAALIDSSIAGAIGLLDSNFAGDPFPSQSAKDLLSIGTSASDQYTLANLRGVIGRMLLNVQITYQGSSLPFTYATIPQPSADFSQSQDTQYIPILFG